MWVGFFLGEIALLLTHKGRSRLRARTAHRIILLLTLSVSFRSNVRRQHRLPYDLPKMSSSAKHRNSANESSQSSRQGTGAPPFPTPQSSKAKIESVGEDDLDEEEDQQRCCGLNYHLIDPAKSFFSELRSAMMIPVKTTGGTQTLGVVLANISCL